MKLRIPALAALLVLAAPPLLGQDRAAQTESTPADIDPPQITVFGSRGDPDRVTGSAHRVDQETLEKYRYDDINRVLNFVPGVYVREEDGVGLRPNIGLRGASADRSQKVTLMEDGVLTGPAPYSAPAAYFFPLTSRMVGVEVFKGPASIQHGPQTIGGAVNLVSAPIPRKTEAMLDVAAGSDAYRRLHARGGSRWDGMGLMAEAIHLGSDGFKQLDGGGDTGFEKNELLAKGAWRIGPGTLELRLGYADEVSDETYLGLTQDDIRADPDRRYGASALDRMDFDWTGGRIGWSQPAFGGDLQLTGYLQNFDRAWRKFNNFNGADIREVLSTPDTPFNQLFVGVLQGNDTDGVAGSPDDIRIGTNDRQFVLGGLQAEQNWAFGTEVMHLLQVGARFHYDEIKRLHDEFGFEQMGGQLVNNGVPRAILTNNTADTEALALWVRDEITHGRWTWVPGVRVEVIQSTIEDRNTGNARDNDYSVVLPGLGVSYEVNPGLRLLAGVHRGFSPAAPSVTVENDPEDSVNYEAGARWQNVAGRFEAIGFYNDYSNLTAICTLSSGCNPADLDSQTSAGEVEAYGLETGWNHQFALTPALSLPMALTYTWTEAEFKESFVSTDPQFGAVEAGFELPYLPEHRANARLGVAGAKWGADLSVSYLSRMRDRAGRGSFSDGEGSDDYVLFDLAARYQVLPRLELNGRVDNLLDEEYVVARRPFGARPGKPQSIQVGVVYRY